MKTEYLVRFLDIADFTIDRNTCQISVSPVRGVDSSVVDHLYVNLVVPLALSHQRKLVLHGSAVEIDDFSVVFAAATGGGKSSLAASFATHGYRFLTDDGVQLAEERGRYYVQPNHPSIRLWQDSSEQLITAGCGISPNIGSVGKFSFLADDESIFCDEPRLLRHVYFLGNGDADVVSIEAMSGKEAIVSILSHSFLLDVSAKPMLAHNLEQVAQLAERSIFYRLDYPRRYEVLDEVRDLVIRHALRAEAE